MRQRRSAKGSGRTGACPERSRRVSARSEGRHTGRPLHAYDKRPRRPKLKSIAFPAISTSGLGYPRADAAAVSSRTIEEFLSVDKSIDSVNLVFFAAGDTEVFLKHQAFSG